jgi:methionyl-tRNA synthetase
MESNSAQAQTQSSVLQQQDQKLQEESHQTLIQKQDISYSDFDKLDIRVGTIEQAEAPEWSKKLLKFTVNFGDVGMRTIFSGIKKWYNPEDFISKQFCFLVNLQPKKMGKDESQGMMLMADTFDGNEDNSEKPTLLPLTIKVPNGTVVR